MSDTSKIEIRSLRKSFGSNEVLKNINLDVAKGSVVAVIGDDARGDSLRGELAQNRLADRHIVVAAARPTTSPTAPYSTRAPPPTGPRTAGPVSTPIRRALPMAVTADKARKAARAARSGSSSCASGAPNTA